MKYGMRGTTPNISRNVTSPAGHFGRLTRENVTAGKIPFRKAWLQAIVDRVVVGADITRIVGDKANLETAIAATGASVG